MAVVNAVLNSGLLLQSVGSVRQTGGFARRVHQGVPERAEAVSEVELSHTRFSVGEVRVEKG
jgi:hypothetical protein